MSPEGWIERGAAEEACFGATRGLCNVCGGVVDAKVVFVGGAVHLVKWCADHGETRGLVSSDVGWYLRALAYVKPRTEPRALAVNDYVSCPESCGLCPAHQQHTCVPILEITSRCDMKCPICLVEGHTEGTLSLEQVRKIMDDLVRYEGTLNMLTLSGGEPTRHPQFLEVLDAVKRPEVGIVSVSTNGLALLRSDDLIRELRDRGVVISLQFDGVRPATYERLRGRADLADKKRRIIDRVLEMGAQLSLTVTLARGVNEMEIPDILKIFFENEGILSMMVQPLAHAGRAAAMVGRDAPDAVTIPEVVERLASGSGGVLREQDFSPLPCSHPTCFALTYLLRTTGGRLVSLPSVIDAETYIDMIKNQALLNTDWETLSRVKDALYALWSSDGLIPNRAAVLATVRRLLLDLNRLGASPSHRDVLDLSARNVKSIFIHQFMDRATFDLSRAVKCCNHYPQADGRLLPVCVRNNVAVTPC